eukprot:COSAG01_NODE_6247_length_3771_cov_379.905229_4_plen_84_part_00
MHPRVNLSQNYRRRLCNHPASVDRERGAVGKGLLTMGRLLAWPADPCESAFADGWILRLQISGVVQLYTVLPRLGTALHSTQL